MINATEITYLAKTIPGEKRATKEDNQDAFKVKQLDDFLLAVVCDGVSASEKGGFGAKSAVKLFIDYCEKYLISTKLDDINLDVMLRGALNHTHDNLILKYGAGIALTTLVAAAVEFEHQKALFINAGDSPGYLIHDKETRMLTPMHISSRPKLINGKTIIADGMPLIEVGITSCLCQEHGVSFSIEESSFIKGNKVILCSDGFDHDAVNHLSNNSAHLDLAYLNQLMLDSSKRTYDDTTAVVITLGKNNASVNLINRINNMSAATKAEKNELIEALENSENINVVDELIEWYEQEEDADIRLKLFRLVPASSFTKDELIKQADKAVNDDNGLLMRSIIERISRI